MRTEKNKSATVLRALKKQKSKTPKKGEHRRKKKIFVLKKEQRKIKRNLSKKSNRWLIAEIPNRILLSVTGLSGECSFD